MSPKPAEVAVRKFLISMLVGGSMVAGSACVNVGTPADSGQNPVMQPNSTTQPSTVEPSNGDQGTIPDDAAGLPATTAPGTTQPAGNANNANAPAVTPTKPLPGPSEPVVPEPAGQTIVPVSGPDRYTWVGRFDLSNPNAIPFTFLASKVGVRFTGTSIAMDIISANNDGFNIVLDGAALPPLMFTAKSNQRYTIAQNLPAGTHVLWLTKRTEFNQSGANTITLTNMVLDSGATFLTPPAPKNRRIEVVGDSGMAGYGVDGCYVPGDPNHPQCPYKTTTQNADYSIPSKVARALDAEVYNISWSGKGVVTSQYDSNAARMLPATYEQRYGNDPSKLWDFSVPMDVVVFAGGANDFIGQAGSGAMADPDKFVQVYADWMVKTRSRYPKALLIAAMGASSQKSDRTLMAQYLTAAVAKAKAASPGGDPNMIFFDYFANDPNGWTTYGDVASKGGANWACNYHPSRSGSQWLADRLAPVIRNHMGW